MENKLVFSLKRIPMHVSQNLISFLLSIRFSENHRIDASDCACKADYITVSSRRRVKDV